MTKIEALLLLLHDELINEGAPNPRIEVQVFGTYGPKLLDFEDAKTLSSKLLISVMKSRKTSEGARWIESSLGSDRITLTVFHN